MGSCISSSSTTSDIHKNKIEMSLETNNNNSIPGTPIKDKDKDPPIPISIPILSKSRVSPFNPLSSYRSHGSREETFYETQGWLESDCEDDFYSVNGDFTPSRGNTPVHPSTGAPRLHNAFSPQVNKALFDGRLPINSASLRSRGSTSVRQSFSSISEVTKTVSEGVVGTNDDAPLKPKKKRLADLFRESMRERGETGLSFMGYESDASQRMGTSPNSPNLLPKSKLEASPLSVPKNVPENYVLQKDKSVKFSQRCFPKLVHIRKHQ